MSCSKSIPEPVAGPRFRAVASLQIEGSKRRRLLALIAGYADAGEPSPPMRLLARRLKLKPKTIDHLLDALVAEGLLEVEWAGTGKPADRAAKGRRNVYTLTLEGR